MAFLAEGTFTGNYEPSPEHLIERADFIVGHEFAAPLNEEEPGLVNIALARFITEQRFNKPVFATESVMRALEQIGSNVDVVGVLRDTSSNTTASQGGTWEELRQAKQLSASYGIRSIHVGQAHHIGRIARQARKIGLEPVLPAGLPAEFDPDSQQWWCRRAFYWGIREVLGNLALRYRDQL